MSKEFLQSELASAVDPFTLNQVIKEAEEKGCLAELSQIQLKNKWIGLALGILVGLFGLDRFYVQSNVCGSIKLSIFVAFIFMLILSIFMRPLSENLALAFAAFSGLLYFIGLVWAFIDLFLVWHLIKKKNAEKLLLFVELYKAKDNKDNLA